MTDDLISRQVAIDAICAICGNDCDKSEFIYNAPQDEQVIMCPEHYALSTLPPAQPEQHLDEWCTDCKEYDHENSCCPRWTKVIRQTRRELQDEFVMTAVDGTLWVTVDDVQKVGIVDEGKSKFCRQFYMDAKPEQRTDLLKAEIKRMKRSFTTCINSDYYTGYMSALSAVEGYIAKMEGASE